MIYMEDAALKSLLAAKWIDVVQTQFPKPVCVEHIQMNDLRAVEQDGLAGRYILESVEVIRGDLQRVL